MRSFREEIDHALREEGLHQIADHAAAPLLSIFGVGDGVETALEARRILATNARDEGYTEHPLEREGDDVVMRVAGIVMDLRNKMLDAHDAMIRARYQRSTGDQDA